MVPNWPVHGRQCYGGACRLIQTIVTYLLYSGVTCFWTVCSFCCVYWNCGHVKILLQGITFMTTNKKIRNNIKNMMSKAEVLCPYQT